MVCNLFSKQYLNKNPSPRSSKKRLKQKRPFFKMMGKCCPFTKTPSQGRGMNANVLMHEWVGHFSQGKQQETQKTPTQPSNCG
jgi:hypothetical protein